ncbi:hypothetical protein AB0H69_47020 [Streptomyces phaeochromogenes]|uniref:hypothetical protein n=1 Tax=Streptomyces phaeochromogenes TaxID=1923 RepID=UPI0033C05320
MTINGKALPPGGGSAQTTVLDHLHRKARELVRPIEASVLDQEQRSALRLRVRPDGASELLEEPYDMSLDIPVQQTATGAPPPTVGALASSDSVPSVQVDAAFNSSPSPMVQEEPTPGASVISAAGVSADISQMAGHFRFGPEVSGTGAAEKDSADDASAELVTGNPGGGFVDWETTVLRVVADPKARSRQDTNRPTPEPISDAQRQLATESGPSPLPAVGPSTGHHPHPEAVGAGNLAVSGPPDERRDLLPSLQAPAAPPGTHVPPATQTENTPYKEESASPHDPVVAAPASPEERVSASVPIPPQLVEGVARVIEAVADGDLPLADAAVTELGELATSTFGPGHPHTLETYALEAYIAHLGGNQAHSTAISLRVAGLRLQQSDPRALDEVQRAAATWELLTSPHTAVPLGRELLALWKQIMGVTAEDDTARIPEGIRTVESRLNAFLRVPAPALAVGLPQKGTV